jgi:hypothetical protein
MWGGRNSLYQRRQFRCDSSAARAWNGDHWLSGKRQRRNRQRAASLWAKKGFWWMLVSTVRTEHNKDIFLRMRI